MTPALNITDTVTNLISLPHEYEWLDFKENWFSKDEIGEYISLVTIPFNKIDAAPFELNAGEEGNIEGNEKGTENEGVNEGVKLSDKEKNIFELLKQNPAITTIMLIQTTGLSRSTVERAIVKLKSLNYIRRIGPDKGGHWEVVEK